MFPHLLCWPSDSLSPPAPVPPAYTFTLLYTLHFLLQTPRNQTGGSTIGLYQQNTLQLGIRYVFSFFHAPLLLKESLISNSVWTTRGRGTVFLDNLYLQIFKSYKICKNANFRSVMARKYKRNFCMANIMLHKKLCKKRNLSTYCLPVCLLANINIVLETLFFPFYHVSQPHNS